MTPVERTTDRDLLSSIRELTAAVTAAASDGTPLRVASPSQGPVEALVEAVAALLRQREQAARQARVALDHSRDMVLRLRADGGITDANETACRILGYPLSSLLAMTLFDIDRQCPTEAWRTLWERSIDPQPPEVESVFRTADGRDIPVEIRAARTGVDGEDSACTYVRDISPRKHTLAAIQESEERLRLALVAANQGLYDLDLRTGEATVSSEYATMLGYDPDAFHETNQRWIDRLHPDDRDRVVEVYRSYVAGQREIYSVEFRQRTKDGGWKWILSLGKIVAWDADGRPLRMLGTHTDITERRRAEDALRESEYFLRRSQQLAHLGSYRLDIPSGRWTSSVTLDEVFGIDASYPRTVEAWVDLVAPEDRQTMTSYFLHDVVERRHRFDKEYRIVRANDSCVRWVHGLGELELDQAGRAIAMFGTIQDVTDRKAFEQALRIKDNAIAVSTNAIGIADATGTLEYVNPSLLRLWGYDDPGELVGHPLTALTHARPDGVRVLDALRTQGRYLGEIVARARDGRVFDVLLSANTVHDEAGRPTHLMTSFVDISPLKRAEEERTRLEAQLFQARKMESIGRLAGGVAHDFNNMLSVILGYAELMRTSLAANDPLLADLAQIELAAQHSRDITRQLLAFSRKQIIEPRAVDLNELITERTRTLSRLIGEEVDLRFAPAADLWKVELDPAQFEQVLMNLAVNARDAMVHGGRLTIATANVELDAAYCRPHAPCAPGPYVMVLVSDEGVGMDEDTRARVFDPFFTTKEVGKGTGLGLATVYGIVSQNRGLIQVESAPGQGTTFRIFFPRIAQTEIATSPPTTAPGAPVAGTILLVEDDDMVRRLVSRMLGAIGYRVVVAETPAAALRLLQDPAVSLDLIFTDVVMPAMSGTELRTLALCIRPNLKVLFTSGYTTTEVGRHGITGEQVPFIQKPFSRDELARKIEEVMAR